MAHNSVLIELIRNKLNNASPNLEEHENFSNQLDSLALCSKL